MTETLVIRLRTSEDAPASWLIIDDNGARSGPLHSGPVADALSLAQDRRTVLVLPASEVTLAEPDLPPVRGAARIAQAVPYALEEHLASDLEALHFAIGPRNPAVSATPVAIIARATLERWRATWEAAGIRPAAAYAESSLVPSAPNAVVLVLDEATLHVKRPGSVAYALDAQPLATAFDLALGATAEPGEHVTLYAATGEYEAHKDVIEGLRTRTATLQVKLLPDGLLPLLAAQIPTAKPINLLQGSFAPPSSLGSHLKQWRLPAALAAATLLLFVGVQGYGLWQLHRAEQQVDAQITRLFQQIMPGQPIVDARAQIEGLLARSGAGGGALLPAVAQIAQAMTQSPGVRVEALTFRPGIVELHVSAPSVDVLEHLKQTMSQGGAQVELQSANQRGQAFLGRLQIKMGAA
jgi:general secretion pathway protein L